jgi:hypothetical protein
MRNRRLDGLSIAVAIVADEKYQERSIGLWMKE